MIQSALIISVRLVTHLVATGSPAVLTGRTHGQTHGTEGLGQTSPVDLGGSLRRGVGKGALVAGASTLETPSIV